MEHFTFCYYHKKVASHSKIIRRYSINKGYRSEVTFCNFAASKFLMNLNVKVTAGKLLYARLQEQTSASSGNCVCSDV